MTWTNVPVHKVVVEFVHSERNTRLSSVGPLPSIVTSFGLTKVLDNPNLNDPRENHARLRLLY
jgi:hypothetical protein